MMLHIPKYDYVWLYCYVWVSVLAKVTFWSVGALEGERMVENMKVLKPCLLLTAAQVQNQQRDARRLNLQELSHIQKTKTSCKANILKINQLFQNLDSSRQDSDSSVWWFSFQTFKLGDFRKKTTRNRLVIFGNQIRSPRLFPQGATSRGIGFQKFNAARIASGQRHSLRLRKSKGQSEVNQRSYIWATVKICYLSPSRLSFREPPIVLQGFGRFEHLGCKYVTVCRKCFCEAWSARLFM